jgi:hypothetical protein
MSAHKFGTRRLDYLTCIYPQSNACTLKRMSWNEWNQDKGYNSDMFNRKLCYFSVYLFLTHVFTPHRPTHILLPVKRLIM